MTAPSTPSFSGAFLASHQPDEARDARFLEYLQTQLASRQIPVSFCDVLALGFAEESYNFEATCERQEVPLMRDLAAWILREHQVEVALSEDFLMIFEECLSNVIRHSYTDGDQKWFRWRLAVSDATLSFRLEDRGEGGRSPVVAERLAAIPPTGRPPLKRGGMGLFLIKRMMDEVSYTPGDTSHTNVLQLRKQLTPRSENP